MINVGHTSAVNVNGIQKMMAKFYIRDAMTFRRGAYYVNPSNKRKIEIDFRFFFLLQNGVIYQREMLSTEMLTLMLFVNNDVDLEDDDADWTNHENKY